MNVWQSKGNQMPLTKDQIKTLQTTQSHYGCGRDTCVACYPIQYACEMCAADFDEPIANGEEYTCPACEWVNNDSELVTCLTCRDTYLYWQNSNHQAQCEGSK
jgi:hypothetical protein